MYCAFNVDVVIVDANKVDAVNEDPISVENDVRENPGILIVDALIVETVNAPANVDE